MLTIRVVEAFIDHQVRESISALAQFPRLLEHCLPLLPQPLFNHSTWTEE
jgi:hypothetical protein